MREAAQEEWDGLIKNYRYSVLEEGGARKQDYQRMYAIESRGFVRLQSIELCEPKVDRASVQSTITGIALACMRGRGSCL